MLHANKSKSLLIMRMHLFPIGPILVVGCRRAPDADDLHLREVRIGDERSTFAHAVQVRTFPRDQTV